MTKAEQAANRAAAARDAQGFRDACKAKGIEPKGTILKLIQSLEVIANAK